MIARGLLPSLKKAHDGHLKYSIDFALKQFWPFWDFEQLVKKKIVEGHAFTTRELQHFNLLKSSDAPLIYFRVLDSQLPNFNPNVAAIIHYIQAILDIQDDFEDIEDIQDGMPNILILATTEYTVFSKISMNPSHARKLIDCSGVEESTLSIIDLCSELMSAPQNY